MRKIPLQTEFDLGQVPPAGTQATAPKSDTSPAPDDLMLYEQLEERFHRRSIEDRIEEYREDSPFHLECLTPSRPPRGYQLQAIARLHYYLDNQDGFQDPAEPVHLLFNMATGSGKTLVMASNILHLYDRGYRVFVFFVNTTAVVDKTRRNFLAEGTEKYEFADEIHHRGRHVPIRKVEHIERVDPDAINIVFTTIQGLHTELKQPSEEGLTWESFKQEKVVFLSDEAHHINALTKADYQTTQKEDRDLESWEGTVMRLLNRNPDNVLLEYTATIDWSEPALRDKYEDKALIRYELKEFREDGYSKDVYLLKSPASKEGRMIRALLLSHHRELVAQEHGIPLKPLVLMKSRNIPDSKDDHEFFRDLLARLDGEIIDRVLEEEEPEGRGTGRMREALDYFDAQGLNSNRLAEALRDSFGPATTEIINSKNQAQELLRDEIHNLEDPSVTTRVIFVVNMLNEGWDARNLFDIVRLDESNERPRDVTTSEVQLIGRGARYFPFELEDADSEDSETPFKRKFDDDLSHELRALEELHYHTKTNNRFIESLTEALVESGLKEPEEEEFTFQVRDSVVDGEIWNQGVVFMNSRDPVPLDRRQSLSDYNVPSTISVQFSGKGSREAAVFEGEAGPEGSSATTLSLSEFPPSLLLHAMNDPDLRTFRFRELQDVFPSLTSRHAFISDDEFLGGVEVTVHAPDEIDPRNLPPFDQLAIARTVLQRIANTLDANRHDWEGVDSWEYSRVREVMQKEVTKKISVSEDRNGKGHSIKTAPNPAVRAPIDELSWYLYDDNRGTQQEKRLIKLLNDEYREELEASFDEYVLLRNEGRLKIFAFDDGRATEPDFIFLGRIAGDSSDRYLQVFMEPKGEHLLENDAWKEEFLEEIDASEVVLELAKQADYRIVGAPFYNHDREQYEPRFRRRLDSLLEEETP